MDLLVPDAPSVAPAVQLALEEALVRAGPPSPLLRIWQNAGLRGDRAGPAGRP